jgi:fumarate reductase subunit D
MRTILLKLEPIIWLLFGQGILIGTMLLTGWILVVGLLIPMGFVDASALSYTRAHDLATAKLLGFIPLGQLVLAALLILPLWKGAHHVRSMLIDFGGGERDGIVGSLLYAIAAAGSVMAIMVLVRL